MALEILDDYLIMKDYADPAFELMKEICRKKNQSLMIAPITVSRDTKVKSGAYLTYEMETTKPRLDRKDLVFKDDPKSDQFWDNDHAKIIVDDFVGSGEQFL